jgi:phenylpropionate dioxygenase-like ring-hydroxylating dioxygenase large terminal subunit
MSMLDELISRLQHNVRVGMPDRAAQPMRLPASVYGDAQHFDDEMRSIFLQVPLLVALACEVPNPGDYVAYDIAGRPLLIVRGDDGHVRTFLNVCRHRGAKVTDSTCGTARRLMCPYHSWSYDTSGKLVAIPGQDTFGEVDITGLVELPSEQRAGAVFAVLDPDGDLDLDSWLAGFDASLAELRLDEFHVYRKPTYIDSPNWKLAADGYLDGYHIGYLHRNSICKRSITNRNTYDFFGPHVRIGFAAKGIENFEPSESAPAPYGEIMSLVHYVFPNISISGGHHDTLMMSRLLPGPAPDKSTTLQFQFYREPIEGDLVAIAEAKRLKYEAVVRDEDCATIFEIGAALDAVGDGHFVFGRNEPANQHLHSTIASMTKSRRRSADDLCSAEGGDHLIRGLLGADVCRIDVHLG